MGILIFINLAAISIYQLTNSRIFSHINKSKMEPVWMLPNYKNMGWARTHFKEYFELKSEFRSYIGWRSLPYKGQTINIDEKGIRITPQSEFATEKSPLVVFLGGSSMWGYGADDANTIPALFAKNAKGRYRTMNLGESDYNAFQGYLFLKLQIIDGLKPDVVVSYDGINDAIVLMHGLRPFSHDKEDKIIAALKGMDTEQRKALSFDHFFLEPIKSLISYYKSKYSDSKNNADFIPDALVEQTAKALLEGWLSTRDLAQQNGAYFVAVLQPNPAMGKPYLKHLKLDEAALTDYKIFYLAVLKLLQTPEYQKLRNNVLVLTDAFDSEEYIYIDHCHVSPNGNKIIAEKIYNHINNFIYNKKKPLYLPP